MHCVNSFHGQRQKNDVNWASRGGHSATPPVFESKIRHLGKSRGASSERMYEYVMQDGDHVPHLIFLRSSRSFFFVKKRCLCVCRDKRWKRDRVSLSAVDVSWIIFSVVASLLFSWDKQGVYAGWTSCKRCSGSETQMPTNRREWKKSETFCFQSI